MWFKSIYLKTLRDYRIAILGWGLGMGLLMFTILASFPALVATPEARQALAALGGTFSWLAEPIAITTAGGYATFKIGFLILLLALWPLLSGSRMLRGEEERGGMDALLSLPRGRVQVALQKQLAQWTALLLMGLLIALITFAGGKRASADFSFGDALLFGLNLALIAAVFGALALFISQFTRDRATAAGLTGGLLLLFIVLDMVHRVMPGAEWLSRISPIYYYNLNKPLVPGYTFNAGALLLLLALCLVFTGAAIWLFARRDISGVVPGPAFLSRPARPIAPARALPEKAWSLRSIYTRSLSMIAVPAFWWTVGIAGFAAWIIVVVKQAEANLASIYQGSSVLKDVITKLGGSDQLTNATFLSALYSLLPLFIMGFAITQATRWAADEESGRLELLLSTPHSRLQVLLARFAALTTATIVMGVVTLLAAWAAAAATGLNLDSGNLVGATLGMIPLGLLIAAIGYLLAGWLSTAIDTGLLSFLLVIWFFISFIGPELNWPEATLRLSAFYYYGTPLLNGLPLGNALGLLAVGVIVLVLASIRFVTKDIRR